MTRPSDELRTMITTLARKRSLDVIFVLGSGATRRGVLRRSVGPDTTDKALERSLRSLGDAGIVRRQVLTDQTPPGVLYALTPAGWDVHHIMAQLDSNVCEPRGGSLERGSHRGRL